MVTNACLVFDVFENNDSVYVIRMPLTMQFTYCDLALVCWEGLAHETSKFIQCKKIRVMHAMKFLFQMVHPSYSCKCVL